MKATFIQVWASTADSSDDEINSFYNDLQITLNSIPKKDYVIILGDFNAKIGTYQPLWKDTVGKFGIGNINECGERLLQFCIANELFVANTVFPHKSSRKWTWNHPDGVHKSMIDYIIVRKRWRSSVFGARSFPGADCGSDHHLVIAKIQLKFKST